MQRDHFVTQVVSLKCQISPLQKWLKKNKNKISPVVVIPEGHLALTYRSPVLRVGQTFIFIQCSLLTTVSVQSLT